MKKSLLIATGLVLLSTSAFATKTRMTSLGQDSGKGSHYVDDTRNVFRNAAHAGSTTNYLTTEWGNSTSTAEGGFFKEAGSFNYGVYLNDSNDSQDGIAGGTSTGYAGEAAATFGSTGFVDRSDNLDLFFAGDMGFQWGARVGYTASSNQDATVSSLEQKHSGMSLGLGVVFGDIEGSVNYVIKDKYENNVAAATTAGATAEGKNMDINLAYNWGSWTFFGEYAAKGVEFASATGAQKGETDKTTIIVGAGHTHEVSSTARIYSDVSFNSVKNEDKIGGATLSRESSTTDLKVNLAFEADATSWLTWRGSVSQSLFIDNAKSKLAAAAAKDSELNDSSTNLAAGATLNFGKLKVDGSMTTADGDVDLDTIITNVAVHYWF